VDLVVQTSSLVVLARVPTARFACRDLTLASAPTDKPEGEQVRLTPGKTSPIAHEPGGVAFGKLVTPPPAPHGSRSLDLGRTAQLVSTRDSWVLVVLHGVDADVRGWIPTDAIDRSPPPDYVVSSLSRFIGVHDANPQLQTCRNAIPIYVKDGNTVARVGTTIAGAKLPVLETNPDALVLDLGGDTGFPGLGIVATEPRLRPFVHRADATSCTPDRASR
jgi:hypothetical protein